MFHALDLRTSQDASITTAVSSPIEQNRFVLRDVKVLRLRVVSCTEPDMADQIIDDARLEAAQQLIEQGEGPRRKLIGSVAGLTSARRWQCR